MAGLDLDRIADELWQARRDGARIARPESLDLDAAYALQDALIRRARDRRAGWKVGATNPQAQAGLGIDGPVSGPLWQDCLWRAGGEVAVAHIPGEGAAPAEVELAFEIGPDGGLAAAMVAVELLGQRWQTMPERRCVGVVSDHGANAGIVLGEAVTDVSGLDLTRLAATLSREGEVVARGISGLVMGDPRRSVDWLRPHAAGRGLPLEPGIRYRAEIEGVGALELMLER